MGNDDANFTDLPFEQRPMKQRVAMIEAITTMVKQKPVYYGLSKVYGSCIKFFNLEEAIEQNDMGRFNIFFQIHDYKSWRRKEWNLEFINGFFIDIDKKDGEVKDGSDLIERLNSLPIRPHFVIKTAGGWHVHYLTEPIGYVTNRRFILSFQKSLTKALGGDKKFTYPTGIMKVPYLNDVFKHERIRPGWILREQKYTFGEIVAISKKWSDFQLIDESELSAPKKEVSEYAEEKLSKINSLDIEDVIPSLFEYLRTQIKCKHPFTFSEGFIYENGVLLTQVRIDEERNKLHDFSNELFDFSWKVSFFVDRFIKYALNNAGMKHLNPNMIRASFYRDVYGLIQNADKMVVLPKDAYLSYHDSVLVPGMRFGEDIRNWKYPEVARKLNEIQFSMESGLGATSLEEIRNLISEYRSWVDDTISLNRLDHLYNMLIFNAVWPEASKNISRTFLLISDYFNRRGITEVVDIKVADLFADYFSKTTFNNKGFVKSLIDDIWTLSRFQDTRKNGKNQESTFRLIGGVSRNIEEKTVSFKFLPDMDKNLIQSRIKYFMPISIVSLDTGNSNFHNFAILLHTHLFINKQNSLSKETVMTWMGIKKDYPNWKQVIEKNLDLFFKQIGITNAYTYSKKSGEFLFTTK